MSNCGLSYLPFTQFVAELILGCATQFDTPNILEPIKF